MTGFWVGGYTADDATGGVRRLDAATGMNEVVVATPDPSYLLASPTTDLLYAVDEGGDAVVALRDGVVVARVAAAGSAPCHLSITADGTLLLAACYGDGRVGVHDLAEDGTPGPARALPDPPPASIGPHPAQDGPHAHSTLELGDLLLVADLGTDRVLVHRRRGADFAFDGAIALPAGSGPRDLLLVPSGPVLVLGEHDARIHVLDVAARSVRVSVPTTTDPVRGDQAAGMTLVGRRLTAGLRGSDRIALLRLDDDGVPEPVDAALTGGTWPRHHAVDGDRLLVANERSGTVTALAFRSDESLGSPGPVARIPSPTFLLATGGAA
ncbi:lactonase family protein [Amnibacterium kyonggiense]|uniref:6-phosphogluconolactonase (Cycloisomerase 2 family) n=1 Tax=Amnibacterium kyonggiense TaxID=595671 RepID=A0A4R7FH77_9MICO|nr:beta-propeller fold lactonase family protein [Amnibacterium kyonggiense]TDS75050.1 6-phosphogluconolactonase (cycloisomerase 2 family) [Amnibacterium kyonggiense]